MITDKKTLDKLNKMAWQEVCAIYPNQYALLTDFELEDMFNFSKFKIWCIGTIQECFDYMYTHDKIFYVTELTATDGSIVWC